jgi:hypothetical protein
LKTVVSFLALAIVITILLLPHWRTDTELTGQMRTLATQSQSSIVSAPTTIVHAVIESAVDSAIKIISPEESANEELPAEELI